MPVRPLRGEEILNHCEPVLKVFRCAFDDRPQGFVAQVPDVRDIDRGTDHGSHPGVIPAVRVTDKPVLALGAMLLEFLEKRCALEEGEASDMLPCGWVLSDLIAGSMPGSMPGGMCQVVAGFIIWVR